METIVKILPASHYVAALSGAPDGITAATHLATVKWIDNVPGKFYVKVFPPNTPRGLVNEITGYLLASALGMPQPKNAAIIQLPSVVINQVFPGKFQIDSDYVWGWASEECGITPNTFFKIGDMQKYDSLLSELKDWHLFPALLAFDDWVANQDRNTGNITVTGKNDFHLIDHGHVPVSECWQPADLVVAQVYDNKLLSGLYENQEYPLPLSAGMVQSAKSHQAAFDKVITELEMWWTQLVSTDSKFALNEFLKLRSLQSPERIKVLTRLLVA